MTRLKAFTLQLVISGALVAALYGLARWAWYPGPLFDLEDGWQGIALVAIVNLVLGPILTLILFRPGKPGLAFDMGVIVLVQAAALVYGISLLNDARPLLLVHADDHFASLSRAVLKEWDASGATLAKWNALTLQQVRVDLPEDPEQYAAVVRDSWSRPGALFGLFDRYQSLPERWQQTLKDAIRIEPYVDHATDWRQRYDAVIADLGRPAEDLAFFPYAGRQARVFLVFDRKTQDIVGMLDIPYDPALARCEVPRLERAGLSRQPAPEQPQSTPRS